jgi:N-acetylmuramate 1-kinase
MRDIGAFLAATPWATARVELLPSDASNRRYSRLFLDSKTAMLADAPPPVEATKPFADIARLLQSLNLAAPHILAEDHEQGFLLLEDFGTTTYTIALRDTLADEQRLYQLALDVLKHLQQQAIPADAVPPYNMQRLLQEVGLYTEWVHPNGAAVQESWLALWQDLLKDYTAPQVPISDVLVLRDYHIDNLMWRPNETGLHQCGLLDFQDALMGHPAYDVASLLQDARRDIPYAFAAEMLKYYGNTAPDFMNAYYVLATQRAFKIVGIFERLSKRDNKHHYRQHLPRVWGYIHENLKQPLLAPVTAWLAKHAVSP